MIRDGKINKLFRPNNNINKKKSKINENKTENSPTIDN